MILRKLDSNGIAAPVIAVIIVVVLAIAGAGYFVYQNNNETEDTASTSNQAPENDIVFDPIASQDLSFAATISGTQEGELFQATMESDGEGNFQMTSMFDGQETRIITTKDAYYTCTGDDCIKMPQSQNTANDYNIDSYVYTDEDIESYQENARYEGRGECPAGTCDIWVVTEAEGTSKIYIDSSSRRISQIETEADGESSKIVFEYKDVTIQVPVNARELEMPTL